MFFLKLTVFIKIISIIIITQKTIDQDQNEKKNQKSIDENAFNEHNNNEETSKKCDEHANSFEDIENGTEKLMNL